MLAELAGLATGSHFTVVPSVTVDLAPNAALPAGTSEAADLSDRLLAFDITASKDDACQRATFTFARGKGIDSLSPLVSSSRFILSDGRPRLDPNLFVTLSLTINGAGPFVAWFGRISRVVSQPGGKINVHCRDFGAMWLNGVIKEAYTVGSAAPVKDAILAIATAAEGQGTAGGIAGTVEEPVATSWVINPYAQDVMTCMDAGRQLVQTFGGDLRVRGSVSWSALSILAPNRSPEFDLHHNRWITDATLGPDRYMDITELSWGDEDVRNFWEGYYRDPTTGLPVGPLTATDGTSASRFGIRYARIFLDRTSNIDSDPEMQAFLDAALADSKDPFASHKITLPLFPEVELDDLHTYQANGDEYDLDLQLAVVAYTHHWESTPGSSPITTIGARGQPIGAYREYRRSVPPPVLITTAAPTAEWAPRGTLVLVKSAA